MVKVPKPVKRADTVKMAKIAQRIKTAKQVDPATTFKTAIAAKTNNILANKFWSYGQQYIGR